MSSELTLTAIELAAYQASLRHGRGRGPRDGELTVGVIGAGPCGRGVVAGLRAVGYRVLIHDPGLGTGEAARLGGCWRTARQLLQNSDVVTLHAFRGPLIRPALGRADLALMRVGAALVCVEDVDLLDLGAWSGAPLPLYSILAGPAAASLPREHPLRRRPDVWVPPAALRLAA